MFLHFWFVLKKSIIVHLIQLFIQFFIKLHLILIQLIGIFFKLLFRIILLASLIFMCLIYILLWSLIKLITLILILDVWILKTLAVIVYFWNWYVGLVKLLFLIWMIKWCRFVHVIYVAFILYWWTGFHYCLIDFWILISHCLYNLSIYLLIVLWHF